MISPEVDERVLRGELPRALVKRLAIAKAMAVASTLNSNRHALVIAADTTVVSPNGKQILNKPKNAKDALRMLKLLQGETHTVCTGYCLTLRHPDKKQIRIARVIATRVKMRPTSKSDLEAYIATGEPMDKAGAYAIQGIGMALVESISGSYTNVVGLPVAQVLADLKGLIDG